MKILLLSRYGRMGASSRMRSLQYLPYLASAKFQVDVKPLFPNAYLIALYDGDRRWLRVIRAYINRLKSLLSSRTYDLIWIEKEALPFIPAFVEQMLLKCGKPYILDYDDAVFHQYSEHCNPLVRLSLGNKINKLMKNASLVMVGNEYLAEHAVSSGSEWVERIPTVVDLERYFPKRHENQSPVTVGWIGTPITSRYLRQIAPVCEQLQQQFSVNFVAVGSNSRSIEATPFTGKPWTEQTEVSSIQSFDIGIMPLPDAPYERGKCGYKIIQYMACGIPVVASPVGVNRVIVKHCINGFLASNNDHWQSFLGKLISDIECRQRMGMEGRKSVEEHYSLDVQAPRIAALLSKVSTQSENNEPE